MQANGYLLPANGATNHAQARSGDGRGNGEKVICPLLSGPISILELVTKEE